MNQQQQSTGGVPGPTGRRLHIAHRRSPSEITPMIMEQLALQQQIDALQQQQQAIAATHQQYVNMGIIPQQQQQQPLPPNLAYGLQNQQQMNPLQMNNLQTMQNFQFPQQAQPAMGMNSNMSSSPGGMAHGHRRNQSALPSMAPPPAPSSGAALQEYSPNIGGGPASRGRGGASNAAAGGHQRRHSLALMEAKKAAEAAQAKRGPTGFQFPIPGAGGVSPSGGDANSDSFAEADERSGQQQSQTNSGLQGLGVRTGPGGHGRSQSLAVGSRGGMGGNAGPQRNSNAGLSGSQFNDFLTPSPNAQESRRGSGAGGHARAGSRNYDSNWRQSGMNQVQQPATIPEQPRQNFNAQQPQAQHNQMQQQTMGSFSASPGLSGSSFAPGHRSRTSLTGQSLGGQQQFGFQQSPQPQRMMQPVQNPMLMAQPQVGLPQVTQLQLAQLQALQMQNGQFPQINVLPVAQPPANAQQNSQQRKTLFTPYLPQANLPALLSDGMLVSGILRVNKKNRSDAYVTCPELDADIFICGSKDRNRALENDLVAVELLDVDEVWSQKREKEEKKKRKDINDGRSIGLPVDKINISQSDTTPSPSEGGLRRRGSLRQRPTQKKNDDVEVEGQSLLLMEEEEINDEAMPLYAGHVVAVVERTPGQMFSGTLGLLRPSSQATKEKQDAERGNGARQERHAERPKIVWFKPTDKRVPLIAIPTEQAPRDFVEKHQAYANRIFVACIKRWPITSLHPFGTLVEQLGEMGDMRVETDALLRDNNFGPEEFSDAVKKSVGFDDWAVKTDNEDLTVGRRDFREESVFTIDPDGSEHLDDALHVKKVSDSIVELGIHVADASYFIKANSLVDREAKKRGTAVYLMNRAVAMLPPKLTSGVLSLSPGQDRLTLSIVIHLNTETGKLEAEKTWVGKGIVKSAGKLTYDDVNKAIRGDEVKLDGCNSEQILLLKNAAQVLRELRYGSLTKDIQPLRLIYSLDDENVPVEQNIFNSSPAHEIIEEINFKANALVAEKLVESLPAKALIRRHAAPKAGRLQTFGERMTLAGYEIDTITSAALQNSIFKVKDAGYRKGMETLLMKTLPRAKYVIAGQTDPEFWPHFGLNQAVYTHFTNPSRRYADIVVHRQLDAILSGNPSDFNEDTDNLLKVAENCNTKKDSAQAAQEQSVHIESCRAMDKKAAQMGRSIISEGIVLCVYESAFDILIPEYGFEKRVHCDQLPLVKAEFRKESRVLELYWETGVASSSYLPEDERGSRNSQNRNSAMFAPRGKNQDSQKNIESETMSTDVVDALFDDDDDDGVSEVNESLAGVTLDPVHGSGATSKDADESQSSAPRATDETSKATKEKYFSWFTLREEGGQHIQDVKEMTRVPVILRTDLTKSPPCLTIRSVNPYAFE